MANQVTPQTPQSYLKVNRLVHLALFMGQFIFGLLVLSITPQKGIDIKNTNDPFIYVVPIITVIAFIASNFMFKQAMNIAIDKPSLREKLTAYQAALIKRFAPIEGASLLAIVAYMKSGNLLFILIFGLTIFYFL